MPSISSRWQSILFLSRGLHSRSAKNCQKHKYVTVNIKCKENILCVCIYELCL